MPEEIIRTKMEDVTASGYWWLPDNEDERLGGTLTFSKKEGAQLELLGMFGDLTSLFDRRREPYPTVYGVTTDGKQVTLVSCQSVASRGNLMGLGVPSETLKAETLVVGAHIPDFYAMPLGKVTFRLSNLEDWLSKPGATYNFPGSAADPFVISYTRPTLPSIRIPGGTLSFRFGWRSFQTQLRSTGVNEEAGVHVTQTSGFTFNEARRDYVWPIQNLLTLCTLEPSDIVEFHVEPKGRPRFRRDPLHVYYQSSVDAPQRDKPLFFTEMFVTAPKLGPRLPKLVRGWLASSDTLRSVLNLYFAVMSGRWMFLESRFLNLVQAAEVFHRYTSPNFVLPKAKHRLRLKEILDQAPADHKEWLRGVLSFSNEPRLGDRLEAVVEASSSILGWTPEEKEVLVRQARDTRHYLTHYDPTGAAKAVSNEKLYWLSEMFLFTVGILLLRYAGVSDRDIRSGLENNQRLAFARKRWRTLNLPVSQES